MNRELRIGYYKEADSLRAFLVPTIKSLRNTFLDSSATDLPDVKVDRIVDGTGNEQVSFSRILSQKDLEVLPPVLRATFSELGFDLTKEYKLTLQIDGANMQSTVFHSYGVWIEEQPSQGSVANIDFFGVMAGGYQEPKARTPGESPVSGMTPPVCMRISSASQDPEVRVKVDFYEKLDKDRFPTAAVEIAMVSAEWATKVLKRKD